MLGPAARVRRALACIAGAAIAAVPVELILMLIFRVNINVVLYGYASPVLIALPLLTGLGAAIGLEVASAETPQTAGQTSAWDHGIDVISLILLGILCGGLVWALFRGRAADSIVNISIALAFLAFGLAAARTLSRWRIHDTIAIRLAPLCALLGLLYSLGMAAGVTLGYAITAPPSQPFFYVPPAWQAFMQMASLGLPIGLWLALMLWLALTLGRRAASPQPAPLAPQSAP